MHETSRLHPAFKRALAGGPPRGVTAPALHPFGMEAIDRVLGGGLAAGRLHEVFPREEHDEGSTAGFAAMLACLLTQAQGAAPTILWLREDAAQRGAGLHGPGLADLGLDPAHLLLGVLPDARALLRTSVDALRCAALGVVVLELGGNPPLLDLTATRRLTLAAEASGVTPLLLRLRGGRAMPSAAQTRWQVASLPSSPLEADAPGHPALHISLLRQRGGAAGLDWTVEWNHEAACFRPAALPGSRFPLPGSGSVPDAGSARDAGNDGGWRIAV